MLRLSLAFLLVAFVRANIDVDACSRAGFTEGLACSSCKLLPEFGLEALQEDCDNCCEDDTLGQNKNVPRYPKAVLEMCDCKLRAFPQIEPFIKGRMKGHFKNLKTKHIQAAAPRLKMMNDKGVVMERLNIESWDTDTVTEYLNERLELE
eukprot:m.9591 g.9591  ORF g.9591 m.9591 type:complete len:150 (-) comp9455_c0_seq1:52-501(-)